MYTERFSLAFVSRVLIDAAERLRPGLGAWSEQVRSALREVFVRELADIKPRFMEIFHDEDYWTKLDAAMLQECFPRYCAVAQKQSNLEAAGYHVWRNGDLLSRGAYALGGLLVGSALVYIPYIPIPETWTFVILLTMFGAPFVPEAQIGLYKRQHRKGLDAIVADMLRAENVDRLYEPMEPSGLNAADGLTESAEPVPAERTTAPPSRTRGD